MIIANHFSCRALSYFFVVVSERLDRIPWIAPECIDSDVPIDSAADQWSFGATLLEICNNGVVPVSNYMLSEVDACLNFKHLLQNPILFACYHFHLPLPNRKSVFTGKRVVWQTQPPKNWPASSTCVWHTSQMRGLHSELSSENSQISSRKVRPKLHTLL